MRNSKTAIDDRTLRHVGYDISQRCRKRIEEVFGWTKTTCVAQVKVRGPASVRAVFYLRDPGLQSVKTTKNSGSYAISRPRQSDGKISKDQIQSPTLRAKTKCAFFSSLLKQRAGYFDALLHYGLFKYQQEQLLAALELSLPRPPTHFRLMH